MLDGVKTLSRTKAARRESILAAAQDVFLAQGFEGATMEGIAEAAGVSKVTLYTYFSDKDAVFQSIARQWVERLRAIALAAMDPDLPPPAQVREALKAKYGALFDILRTSPYCDELMASKARISDLIQDIEADVVERFAVALGDAQLARVMFNACLGLLDGASSREELEADIALMVDGLAAACRR